VADPTRRQVEVQADGTAFPARLRLDTRREVDYYRHGGVLPYVLRTRLASLSRMAARAARPGG
jgi:aconitate hydratase